MQIISYRALKLPSTRTSPGHSFHAHPHRRLPRALYGTSRVSTRATESPQTTCLHDTHDSTGSNMLFLYVSLRRPWMIALVDLPITTSQRSSLWSRRTRRELRDLARSHVVDSLREGQCVGSDRNDDSLVATVRQENLERHSIERHKANGEWYHVRVENNADVRRHLTLMLANIRHLQRIQKLPLAGQ